MKTLTGYRRNCLAALLFLFLLTAGQGSAQGERLDTLVFDSLRIKQKRNAFYFELAGNAGLYSMNYERQFIRRPHFIMATRIGAGFLPNGKRINQSYLAEQDFCFGPGPWFIEAGFGLTLQRKLLLSCDEMSYAVDNMYWGLARLGVRLQSDEKGTMLRLGILPIFYYCDSCGEDWAHINLYGGISYGFLFGRK